LAYLRTLPAIYAQETRCRRGAPGYGQMINNVNDILDYENGPSVDGVRYSNVSRLGRFGRGACRPDFDRLVHASAYHAAAHAAILYLPNH